MNKKFVIIGAGASGISAATKLFENGYKNILILEAENRIGGRINTIPFASNVVDMGAQWCHGEVNNVVYEMSKNYNLFASTKTKYDRCLFIESNGNIIPEETCNKLMTLIISIVELHKDEMKNYKGSLGNFITEKFSKAIVSPEYNDVDPILANQLFEFYHKYENSIEASDTWYDASCKGYCDYWDCDGDRLLNWKDKGYKTVFDLLMKKIPNDKNQIKINDKIEFNKTVTTINWKPNNESTPASVSIKCSDGTNYDAEHVICTVSLGVLKERHMKMFEPELPMLKRYAIEGLTIGTVDKIFIEFEKPFWPNDWRGFSVLWRQNDLNEIRKLPDNWLEDVFGFYTVDYQPNIICGWISGVNARKMEMTPLENVRNGIMMLLRKFITEWTVPDPIRIERSTWYSNPNFRGSYTFQSMKSDLLNTCPAHLAMPLTNTLGQPIIQFAGEATHDHYYSTVHGAVESGWREANRIMEYYKKNICDNRTTITTTPKSTTTTTTNNKNKNFANILILGGGLAGLGAAMELQKNNIDYLVLEGQMRLGGRINTIELLDLPNLNDDKNYVFIDINSNEINNNNNNNNNIRKTSKKISYCDAGAQWLHGKNNELYKIANDNNLLIDEQSEEGIGTYIRNDGYKLNDYFVKKIDFQIGQILEECEQYAKYINKNNTNNKDRHGSYPKSIEHYLRQQFEKKIIATLENAIEKELARQLLDWHIRFHIIDNSCLTLNHVSAKSWGKYSFNGESCQAHYNFKNGFTSLINVLCTNDNYIDKEKIYNNKNVCVIELNDRDRMMNNNNTIHSGLISVRCTDDTIYYCNHILVTFSIGVLKENMRKMFKPKLPEWCQQTINDIGFQTINKIFLQYENPWWHKDIEGIQLIYDNNDYMNKSWTRHITGFDILKTEPLNTLLAWVGGPGAIAMENLTDEQIINDIVKLLTKFMKQNVPAPNKYFCTRWHNNKFFNGSYSYISTDSDKNTTFNDDLLKPITLNEWLNCDNNVPNIKNLNNSSNNNIFINNNNNNNQLPILLFAGEACHEQYFSTGHGAFLSGIEQAQKLIQYFN